MVPSQTAIYQRVWDWYLSAMVPPLTIVSIFFSSMKVTRDDDFNENFNEMTNN